MSGDKGHGGNGRDATCRVINLVIWIRKCILDYSLNVVEKVVVIEVVVKFVIQIQNYRLNDS